MLFMHEYRTDILHYYNVPVCLCAPVSVKGMYDYLLTFVHEYVQVYVVYKSLGTSGQMTYVF